MVVVVVVEGIARRERRVRQRVQFMVVGCVCWSWILWAWVRDRPMDFWELVWRFGKFEVRTIPSLRR